MKKSLLQTISKAVVLLLAVCTVLQVPVSAATGDDAGVTPRASFTNEPVTTPDLYITKEVTADAGLSVPTDTDTEFHFTLTVDNQPYRREVYTVTDADGSSVDPGKKQGASLSFQTDNNGGFSLMAGQTAKFEYVGEGKTYQVTEDSLPDHYALISPVSGTASGTVAAGGTHVHIKNKYLGETLPDQKKTDLLVSKTTTYPEGYEIPGDSNPDFTFAATLEGETLADQKFVIEDISGKTLGSSTTDDDGKFTLKGNQQARFTDVTSGVDFSVREVVDAAGTEGWIPAGYTDASGEYHSVYNADGTPGEMLVTGATSAPLTHVTFRNARASFMVTKRMSDGTTPDQEFSYTLTNSAGKLWAGAEYYLYNSDNKLAEQESKKTDSAGRFTLRAGQQAVFVGIAPGTTYSIKENAVSGYMQVTPKETSGYTNKVVSDDIETLPFVNKVIAETESLTVTKKIRNTEDQAAPTDQEFTFTLLKENSDGTEEPAANTVYTIQQGLDAVSYKTDENGQFKLKADETANFAALATGYRYRVQESGLTKEYTLNEDESTLEGTLEKNGSLNLIVTNDYRPKLLNLEIKKQALSFGGAPLAGAGFKLYTAENLDSTSSFGGDDPYLTDEDGKIIIPGLVSGEYWLKEVKAPDGYLLSDRVYHIVISRRAGETVASSGEISGGITVKIDDNAVPISLDTAKAGDHPYITMDENDLETAHITVINSKIPILPKTGGSGIFLIVLAIAASGIVSLVLRISVFRGHGSRKNK